MKQKHHPLSIDSVNLNQGYTMPLSRSRKIMMKKIKEDYISTRFTKQLMGISVFFNLCNFHYCWIRNCKKRNDKKLIALITLPAWAKANFDWEKATKMIFSRGRIISGISGEISSWNNKSKLYHVLIKCAYYLGNQTQSRTHFLWENRR